MIISERIFKIMDERGMTQKDFSRLTGISQSTICDWKRKKTNPSSDKIMTICNVLGVTPFEILSDSSDDSHGHDFIVCSAGTDNYEILVELESLDIRQKDRVKGFIEALKSLS